MPTLRQRIWEHVKAFPGCTELDIARRVIGPHAVQQQVNPTIREMVAEGNLIRNERVKPYTYTIGKSQPADRVPSPASPSFPLALTEDEIKAAIRVQLESQGYTAQVAMGRERGVDIDARRGHDRWIIEVKGPGLRPQVRVNYFLAMLGELLQRMDDPEARYSIALPDLPQFRRLWERLPKLAKERNSISALFVERDGTIHHVT